MKNVLNFAGFPCRNVNVCAVLSIGFCCLFACSFLVFIVWIHEMLPAVDGDCMVLAVTRKVVSVPCS